MQTNNAPVVPFRAPKTAEPANIDAEYDVIGALLIDPGAISRIAHRLPPEAFYVHSHRVIYQVCLQLHRDGQIVDLMTVCTALSNSKQLERVGGKAAIAQMFDLCLTSANVEQHAELILEKHQRRCLARLASELQRIANDQTKNIQDCLSSAEANFRDILMLVAGDCNAVPLSEVIAENVGHTEQAYQGGGLEGIPTGFYDLDEMTRGVLPGDLTILAGRPSMGKTAGLVNVAVQVANSGHGVYIASLEMSAQQVGYRCLAADAHLSANKIREGKLGANDWEDLTHSVAKLSGLPIWIDDSFRQTPEVIAANVQRINAENGPGTIKLVMVDYLQLMGNRGSINRVSELGQISRGLKGMAKELELSVWALSQLSRGVEARNPKRPMMSDLRESGNIEEDADTVILLYRDDYYDPESSDRGLAEWIVGKNRNGPTGTAKLLFEPVYTRFRNLAGRTA
ncbi:replicative dna helicase [Leptolyngbya sp. Heron Island J]|uniref:replicative DNA helicase n=1 Tax=Leptolyngbya sp. Heron Island J TaxID=1385935 RepID=UPI0003B9F5DF|nr:replicative DNA helicase [Leptolyngbya sp. Heron Island J]ESA37649.1 replicative dna helicase [Leptolyngbya sp. Heron Island J]